MSLFERLPELTEDRRGTVRPDRPLARGDEPGAHIGGINNLHMNVQFQKGCHIDYLLSESANHSAKTI
jgi:hypothetical protein